MNPVAYRTSVWLRAKADAEAEIMRASPTIPGGKLPGESVIEYVERGRDIQDAGFAKFEEACLQLRLLGVKE